MTGISLLIGLGNPGTQYSQTRHNVGQWLVESFASQEKCQFQLDTKLQSRISRIQNSNIDCRLCLPTTYMNESGTPVQKLMHYFKVPPESVLVVHDELDLPAGVARFKTGGGHGGHNGLRDITAHIGNNFHRLRIGIGHQGNRDLVTSYVLNAPTVADRQRIEDAIHACLPSLKTALSGDILGAMNTLHTLLQ